MNHAGKNVMQIGNWFSACSLLGHKKELQKNPFINDGTRRGA